jgi:DNA invertase Pin-like site-specific DNA recombinase
MAKDNRSPQVSTAQEIPLTVRRVALYARVSTNNHGQNPEVQLGELRTYASRRGWSVVDEYVDHVSGSKERRPALDKLWVDCRKRLIDAVVVYRYDRFARSLRQLVNALCEFEGAWYSVCLVT